MENEFNPRAMRMTAEPPMRAREMARKMGISDRYLRDMEEGVRPWPQHQKTAFISILNAWRQEPTPHVRKRRKDFGTKKPKQRRRGPAKPHVPVVAHSHHEIVGIG